MFLVLVLLLPQSFSNTLLNRRNLKAAASRFRVGEKHFENGAFSRRIHFDNNGISLPEFSPDTNPI